MGTPSSTLDFSVVLPCLNEAETLAGVIHQVGTYVTSQGLAAEIIVADNGSSDGSQEIARSLGATVVDVPIIGYGSALRAGIFATRSKYVVMGDADGSYALDELSPFLEKLREGYDLVVGNRFAGGIYPGAMPWMHKYVGNPLLSWLGRLFFKTKIYDFHCGLRGMNRESVLGLNLTSNGMEYATEMIVKASLRGLQITEVPTTLRPDGRSRSPHLRTWRDGWRHLIFLLAASPRWLFLYPGAVFFGTGIVGMLITLFGSIQIGPLQLGMNTYLFSLGSVLVGLQILLTSILARIFSVRVAIPPKSKRSNWLERNFTLERGIILGLVSMAFGIVDASVLFANWSHTGFTYLNFESSLRISGIFVLFFSSGLQLIFASFFASILQDY
jgi:glycosyltransferase involved in cell wall biosynthesis